MPQSLAFDEKLPAQYSDILEFPQPDDNWLVMEGQDAQLGIGNACKSIQCDDEILQLRFQNGEASQVAMLGCWYWSLKSKTSINHPAFLCKCVLPSSIAGHLNSFEGEAHETARSIRRKTPL